MSFKIAIATTDGKNINAEFNSVKKYLILEVELDGTFKSEGYRSNPNTSYVSSDNGCKSGSCGGCGGGCSEAFSVEFLWDCHYVLSTSFGHKVTKFLNRIFIDALEVSLPIDKAVIQVARYEKRRSQNGSNKDYRSEYTPSSENAQSILPDIAVKQIITDGENKDEASKSARIAIASSDGKIINQHFGHASSFHIFELTGNKADFVESRDVNRCCNGQAHNLSSFDKVAQTLNDCKAIVVAKIGEGASSFLESKGFEVFEAPFAIDAVIKKILDEKLLEA